MKRFRFLKKPFDLKDFDIPNFRFVGVSAAKYDDDGRSYRHMIYEYIEDGTVITAEIIRDNHEAYGEAPIIFVRNGQVINLPSSITMEDMENFFIRNDDL